MRRFMYLWHVLHRDTTELISKIYATQKCQSVKGDWALIINEERSKYGITETDENISKMSKTKFKKIVKLKLKTHAIKYLRDLAEPHSKSTGIKNNKFEKQSYFEDRRFSKEEVQLLFTLRTKMLECKTNFSEQYQKKLQCRLCKAPDSIENEDHLLTCSILNTQKHNVQFSYVYGTVDEQYEVIQIFKNIVRRWRMYLESGPYPSSKDGPDVPV